MKQILKDQNVLSAIKTREYSHTSNYRNNLKLLRTLMCRSSYEFKKVWEKYSPQLFSCERSTLFMNNYTKCFSGYSRNNAPVHRFTLPPQPNKSKIVDAVLSYPKPTGQLPFQTCMPHLESPAPKMFAVTSNNKLLVYTLHTGQCLTEVLVLESRAMRLKTINWLLAEEMLVLSTTLCQREEVLAGRRPVAPNTVKILAVFSVQPLEFVCMFEVQKHVFGADLVDAMMSHGMLITMHQSCYIRMYDLDDLLPQAKSIKLFDPVPCSSDHYGQAPTPLPINLVISELPRCLFEVRCEDHNVQMGGYPWHYLISPYGQKSIFGVYSLESGSLARNGYLDVSHVSIEADRAAFHADESGRIIHIGPETIQVFKLQQDKDDKSLSALTQDFTICLQHSPANEPSYNTASGRLVKKRFSLDEISGANMCLTIHEVDYEDELDVMVICSTIHQPDALHGTLGLYDNATGHLLKTVKLQEPWNDYSEHHIFLDVDTLIQVVKSTNGKFVCQMYRLQEQLQDENAVEPVPKQTSGTVQLGLGSSRPRRQRR